MGLFLVVVFLGGLFGVWEAFAIESKSASQAPNPALLTGVGALFQWLNDFADFAQRRTEKTWKHLSSLWRVRASVTSLCQVARRSPEVDTARDSFELLPRIQTRAQILQPFPAMNRSGELPEKLTGYNALATTF